MKVIEQLSTSTHCFNGSTANCVRHSSHQKMESSASSERQSYPSQAFDARKTSTSSALTPQSSNGSSSRKSLRHHYGISERALSPNSDRLPSAGLLQERLLIKKAVMQRERGLSVDVERASQSSPVRSSFGAEKSMGRQQRTPTSAEKPASFRKGLGIKDMEEVCFCMSPTCSI